MPDVPFYGQWSATGVKPFEIYSRIDPAVTTDIVTARFYSKEIDPDYEVPARLVEYSLLKGRAYQMNRPLYNLRTISIKDGLFLSKQDYVNFSKIYHINLIGHPEPYPNEFLVLREEYAWLRFPSGREFRITMLETPQLQGFIGIRSEWTYQFSAKFRMVPPDDEQEELT